MSRLLSLLGALLLCAGSWAAQAPPPWIAVTEEWPPFNYADANGNATGFSTEVLQHVLAKAQLSMPIKIFPWARSYRMATLRENTLIFTLARTPEREKLFTWIGPIAARESYLFRLGQRAEIQPKTPQEIGKYVVGVVRADVSERELLNLGLVEGRNLDVSSDDISLFRKLKAGIIDMLPSNELAAQYRARQLHFDHELVKVMVLVKQGGFYLGVSKNSDPVVVSKLQKAMDELKQSGELGALYNHYLDAPK